MMHPNPRNRKWTQASWRRGYYWRKLLRTLPLCTVLLGADTSGFAPAPGVGRFRNRHCRREQ